MLHPTDTSMVFDFRDSVLLETDHGAAFLVICGGFSSGSEAGQSWSVRRLGGHVETCQGQRRYPKELLRQSFRRTVAWTFWRDLPQNPCFIWIVPSNCSENSLVLFVRFLGFGILFWLLNLTFLSGNGRPFRNCFGVLCRLHCASIVIWLASQLPRNYRKLDVITK